MDDADCQERRGAKGSVGEKPEPAPVPLGLQELEREEEQSEDAAAAEGDQAQRRGKGAKFYIVAPDEALNLDRGLGGDPLGKLREGGEPKDSSEDSGAEERRETHERASPAKARRAKGNIST